MAKSTLLRLLSRSLTLAKDYEIRLAILDDLDRVYEIKEACSMDNERIRLESGQKPKGFILGCSKEKYNSYIDNKCVYLLTKFGEPIGFNVLLEKEIAEIESSMIHTKFGKDLDNYVYYDQYCVHPDFANRSLAFNMITILCKQYYDKGIYHVFGTVVKSPINNENSHRVLTAVGMKEIDELHEEYDNQKIISTLYYINDKELFGELE